jgi:hypothetical protein
LLFVDPTGKKVDDLEETKKNFLACIAIAFFLLFPFFSWVKAIHASRPFPKIFKIHGRSMHDGSVSFSNKERDFFIDRFQRERVCLFFLLRKHVFDREKKEKTNPFSLFLRCNDTKKKMNHESDHFIVEKKIDAKGSEWRSLDGRDFSPSKTDPFFLYVL